METMTPAEVASKQIRRTSESTIDIERGIKAVTESPTAKAADNLDKAKTNYNAAIDSGKMARNLRSVTLEDWRGKTLAKVGRIPEGVEQARDKIEKFHGQRAEHQAKIDRELDAMPQRTLTDSIARATHQMREMAKFSFDRSK